MKAIRFISNDANQKQFALEVRKRVALYFKEAKISNKGNLALYIKTFVMLALYIAPFVFILTIEMNHWVALLVMILMGVGEAGIGMCVMHDAAHGAYSSKDWVNRLFASTLYILGTGVFNWKIQHNLLHHTFTNIYEYDQDIETKAVIRLCEHAPIKLYHRFQYIYAFFFYGLLTLSKLFSDFGQLRGFNRAGITKEQKADPKRETLKLYLAKSLYLLVILGVPFAVTDYKWWQILIGFSVMHITAGIIMSTVFQTAHVVQTTEQPLPDSHGIIHREWAVHQLRTTSDFARNNRLLSWYVGGLNFQVEHHLFSNISHVHYRKIAPIVQKTAKEFGIPYHYQPSFAAALYSHMKKLRSLGRK